MRDTKILLIEDNPDDAELMQILLTEANYSLSEFVCADELSVAIRLLSEQSYEVVLLDISLPDSHGTETFYKLHNQIPEVPIIIISGNREDSIIGNLLQNGAQDYLIKGDIDPGLLEHSVEHAIERQRLLVSLNRKTEEIQSLRESLEHLIFNNADAIIVVDHQGIIRFANPAAADIFNRTQNEMIGNDFGFPVATGKSSEIDIFRSGGQSTVAELRAVEITWKNEPAYLASVRDVTEQKQRQDEMMRMSFQDSLTGLYNRCYFKAEVERLNTDRNLPLCLIMGDVNNLKLINDALGHSEGDRLLIKMAEILKQSCRKGDIVIRYGGDEFIIVLPKCTDKVAARVINRIKELCKNIKTDCIPASIALGTAFQYNSEEPLSDLLKHADERMYANKLTENRSRHSSFISSLEKTLYEKDYVTAEHALRVRDLCLAFGNELQLSDSIIDELSVLASLHDIGKIAIPESILKKRGPLTDDEWAIIKKHPEMGYRITKATHGMSIVADDILYHHERWDGLGYPHGLQGEQIPLASRILSIVDTFDVMTHDRPYKKALSKQEALNEIKRCSGTQFDPEKAEAFVQFTQKLV